MIDRKAFRSLSSGLYLVTAKAGERRCGCVVNTLVQVASEPRPRCRCRSTRRTPPPPPSWSRAASPHGARRGRAHGAHRHPSGFHTSADTDKFAACTSALDGAEVPYVTEHGLARFSVSVTETIDAAATTCSWALWEEAEVLASGDPAHLCLLPRREGRQDPAEGRHLQRGRRSRRFPGLPRRPPARRCRQEDRLALHHLRLHRGRLSDGLPEGYMCPICGAPREMFERVEL